MSHDMGSIAGRLRAAGFRVTPQRQLILDAICRLGGHVTPEAVYEDVRAITPSLNPATVYRTLRFLSERRIITATQLPDGRMRYELAGDEPHHHLVCRECDAAVELPHALLQKLYGHVAQTHDFVIDMDHISFFGLCGACRAEAD